LLVAVAAIPTRTKQEDWSPPAELDEYQLIRPLGRGGMGSVWLAEDRLLQRLVALKFIAHAEPDRHTRERFIVEARAAARLQHVNVVTVHRYGEIAGRPYLVSEYIRGESLDALAKPVTWQRALDLGIALARGLAAAHRHGIIHRDIKPANAILTIDGDAKLVDFGLARMQRAERPSRPPASTMVDDGTDGLTAPGAIAGTPRYLAPEVRRGETADKRSDVYGIGCILYELLIGRAPILDLQHDATDLAGASNPNVPAGEIRPIAQRIEPAGAALAAIVERCLASERERRYPSGDDLREALEQLRAPVVLRGEMPEGNPYRGLVPFEAEHRALFFGRGSDTRAVLERLRSDPFVIVTGDSGSGKSSLCRAGVVPAIASGGLDDGAAWSVVQLVPGHRPLTALTSLLAALLARDETGVAALC
jgi:serine/threonine protein kinase